MARLVEIPQGASLADYEAVAHLSPAVAALRAEAVTVVGRLRGRTVWMVNSTDRGGGVAELLPGDITLLRELGIATKWAVIEAPDPSFFSLTKRIHNLIHGVGRPGFSEDDRRLYEAVNRENAAFLAEQMADGDILIVHDPQPMPLAAMIRERRKIVAIWRSHIGLDQDTACSRSAWEFLRPWADAYDEAIFSAPEYIAPYFSGRATVIHPAIDPLAAKNRDLRVHGVVGILANGALAVAPGPLVRPTFSGLATRLQWNGAWTPAVLPEDIGLLTRPIVTQISRWDRLKGFLPLLRGFIALKERLALDHASMTPLHQRRLELTRLVLAGPEPSAIADDPEGLEVIAELREAYLQLHPAHQEQVAIVALPMVDLRQNALMVNALQRASSVVVQNSLREGFGLTVSEAMWKRTPVLASSRACGPRHQVRDGIDGRLVADPEDPDELSRLLIEMLNDNEGREVWGRNAQRRVHEEFLLFTHLRRWIQLLGELVKGQS